MGYIRFLLAVIVASHHCNLDFTTIGGLAAVEAFFLISGFYMAAAYEKHYQGKPLAFIASRLVRLYPFYIFVVALTIAYRLVMQEHSNNEMGLFHFFGSDHPPIFANFSMIGLDLVEIDNNAILVPSAWSISAELVFYALVPLMLLFRRWLGALIVAAFVFKLLLWRELSWQWAYFPSFGQIGYFMIGVALFFARERLVWPARAVAPMAALYTLYVLSAGHSALEYEGGIASSMALMLATAAILPTLFARMNGRLSTFLGDVSYGLYLVHMLVIQVGIDFGIINRNSRLSLLIVQIVGVVVVSTAIAASFEVMVQQPLDKWRRARFYRQRSEPSTSAKLVAADGSV
jgi:peptidoglycan/LPS O-acetylase OafA/YrhL